MDADVGYDPSMEYEEGISKIFDPDYVEEDGTDIFDRIGMTHLGGRGFVTGIYHYLVRPALKMSRKVVKKYKLGGLIKYIFLIGCLLLGNELFMNR